MAVAISRVTHRLAFSTALNLGILVVTLAGAWILMPRMGIAGVGVAWLGAQTLGAIASVPAYLQIREPVVLTTLVTETQPDPGIAQLIWLAKQQSMDRAGGQPGPLEFHAVDTSQANPSR